MNIPVKRSSMPGNRQPTNIATGKGRSKQRPKMLIKSINSPLLKGRKRSLPALSYVSAVISR
ncbi:hypothetical protein EC970246_A0001 [Escherichia coli 97.0246]|uniref:Uncharacterized protein n=1 Tax=Escherichia coli 97.0246 TaxID=869670 RepID=A0A8E0FP17_ECOLX|nr:hypothetical protein EC970246_A0001 [Escherichia coli 97.0246]